MHNLKVIMLESNKQIQINLEGGDLFYDIGFLLLKEFLDMRKQHIDTICLKLLKIVARVVHLARNKILKLCSGCPYKREFFETLENIHNFSY